MWKITNRRTIISLNVIPFPTHFSQSCTLDIFNLLQWFPWQLLLVVAELKATVVLKPGPALSGFFFSFLSLFTYLFILNLGYLRTLLALTIRIIPKMRTWEFFKDKRCVAFVLFLFFTVFKAEALIHLNLSSPSPLKTSWTACMNMRRCTLRSIN